MGGPASKETGHSCSIVRDGPFRGCCLLAGTTRNQLYGTRSEVLQAVSQCLFKTVYFDQRGVAA